MTLTEEQKKAIELLRNAEFNTNKGTPEELFLFVSSIVPISNVDLFVTNERSQLLLARRNDAFYEKNWHIPGGCLRFYESLEERVRETGRLELHSEISFDPNPIAIRNVVRGDNLEQLHPRERGHNVAILYKCTMPTDYIIQNGSLTEDDQGYLKWFDKIPKDFSVVQHVYDDILKSWGFV